MATTAYAASKTGLSAEWSLIANSAYVAYGGGSPTGLATRQGVELRIYIAGYVLGDQYALRRYSVLNGAADLDDEWILPPGVPRHPLPFSVMEVGGDITLQKIAGATARDCYWGGAGFAPAS